MLGAGGTLAKHAENGDSVWIYLCSSRSAGFEMAARRAGDALGSIYVRVGEFDDQQFDVAPLLEIIEWIEDVPPDPDIIYTHHPGDLNLDHALTARAVLTAFRPKPGEKPRTILACEVLSSTEWTFPPAFAPNWFVSLTGEQLQKKISAMECYESELQEWPHPRSRLGIRNLAAYRGQQAGVEAAEAFQLLRGGPF